MADKQSPEQLNRLSIKKLNEVVLGVKIPKVQIPIAAGRNIAVLVEVAIRNHMLLLRGVNATKQFTQRQQREMKKSANTE
jgi:HPr kinase/phosphorylase